MLALSVRNLRQLSLLGLFIIESFFLTAVVGDLEYLFSRNRIKFKLANLHVVHRTKKLVIWWGLRRQQLWHQLSQFLSSVVGAQVSERAVKHGGKSQHRLKQVKTLSLLELIAALAASYWAERLASKPASTASLAWYKFEAAAAWKWIFFKAFV